MSGPVRRLLCVFRSIQALRKAKFDGTFSGIANLDVQRLTPSALVGLRARTEPRTRPPVVAGPAVQPWILALDSLDFLEERVVDEADHPHHVSRHLLLRLVVFREIRRDVTMRAADTKRVAVTAAHHAKQAAGGDALQGLDVLEDFFGRQILLALDLRADL